MCAVLFGLAKSFHANDVLEGLDKVFSVVGGLSGFLGLVLTVRALPSAIGPTGTPGRHADPAALDGLAAAVEQVWRRELSRRRLANPHPLPVAWTTVGPPIADHWSNIRSDGDPTPLNLDGCLDLRHTDALHQVLRDKRLRGRVVILGEPGAGKTSLLLREALQLLQVRTPTDRVPVLLRLPTWNPDEQTLEQWINSQLATEYGYRSPIPTRQLLPLLDGLDEMPAPRRARAVQAISNTFDPDQPLVLTSRTTEYLDTLTTLPDTTMAAAAVLELTPIHADVVRAYLPQTTSRPADWEATFNRDTTQHDGRLATALNAPLWIDLARITHTDPDQPDNQPAKLLDLPDTETIHTYLLDRLIPAAYPDPPEPDPTGHTWQRADADRYLRNLAKHMHRRNTQDLAWWELARAVPLHIRRAGGLAFGLAGGLAVGLTFGLTFGLAVGLLVGFTGGILVGLATPTQRQIRWRRSSRPLIHRIGSGLAVGLAGGLAFGLTVGLAGGLAFGLAFGLTFGLTFGLVQEFTTFFDSGDADIAASDPLALLRNDRRRALAESLAVGLALGLTLGLAFGLTFGLTGGLTFGLTFGLTGGLTYGLATNSWCAFQYARLWWCTRNDLPWPIMAFLADAHRRGVLRQAGGVYQFRHGLLRDRLN
ncbi:NACHT domain-containing protein [Micromonospora chalcea]|uniref:NACHT domain-containing protein n=1 Tax=Micromonospora chalcea TaxID=1874 RepID=UPI002378A87F|nr:NACHT domain-containing protein [Micromonospora chalcea]WDQ00122.1 NACHT domain-containing protein [Micromonospora chalcea]